MGRVTLRPMKVATTAMSRTITVTPDISFSAVLHTFAAVSSV